MNLNNLITRPSIYPDNIDIFCDNHYVGFASPVAKEDLWRSCEEFVWRLQIGFSESRFKTKADLLKAAVDPKTYGAGNELAIVPKGRGLEYFLVIVYGKVIGTVRHLSNKKWSLRLKAFRTTQHFDFFKDAEAYLKAGDPFTLIPSSYRKKLKL